MVQNNPTEFTKRAKKAIGYLMETTKISINAHFKHHKHNSSRK